MLLSNILDIAIFSELVTKSLVAENMCMFLCFIDLKNNYITSDAMQNVILQPYIRLSTFPSLTSRYLVLCSKFMCTVQNSPCSMLTQLKRVTSVCVVLVSFV